MRRSHLLSMCADIWGWEGGRVIVSVYFIFKFVSFHSIFLSLLFFCRSFPKQSQILWNGISLQFKHNFQHRAHGVIRFLFHFLFLFHFIFFLFFFGLLSMSLSRGLVTLCYVMFRCHFIFKSFPVHTLTFIFMLWLRNKCGVYIYIQFYMHTRLAGIF